jgi:hypothetical protein
MGRLEAVWMAGQKCLTLVRGALGGAPFQGGKEHVEPVSEHFELA